MNLISLKLFLQSHYRHHTALLKITAYKGNILPLIFWANASILTSTINVYPTAILW